MSFLNVISFIGIFVLCAIAWLFSENRNPKVFPWRVVIMGILLQLGLGALVFVTPGTREALQGFSQMLNVLFEAADAGARFVFGHTLIPLPGKDPVVLSPLAAGDVCGAGTIGQAAPGFCGIRLGYIFAFRALPTVIFFSGLIALLYNLGVIQIITNLFAKIFYSVMRLSGAEALSGAANIFVGIEAAIVVRPFIAKMTRSELCAILACCFGTVASSTLAIYANFLRPVFPNILGHLISASMMAIPACFVLSKILVPETERPLTAGGIPNDRLLQLPSDSTSVDAIADPMQPRPRMSPMDAAILGALDGVKMAVSIAAVLILVLGLVFLVNQCFGWLATLPGAIGSFFQVATLQNLLGLLFLPLTVLTGISLEWNELWQASVLIGRRLFETEIPSFQALGAAAALPEATRVLGDRAILITSYALTGFAHLASVGIFVGGLSAIAPNRRREITRLGWKALFVGTLATYMIACVAGVFDTGNPSILGKPAPAVSPAPSSPTPAPSPAQTVTPTPSPQVAPPASPEASPAPAEAPAPVEAPPVEAAPVETPPVETPPVEASPQASSEAPASVETAQDASIDEVQDSEDRQYEDGQYEDGQYEDGQYYDEGDGETIAEDYSQDYSAIEPSSDEF